MVKNKRLKIQAGLGLSLAIALPGGAFAELPSGGVITSGIGAISVHGGTMTINQSTPNLVADWQSFSVGAGNTVEFVQPSTSAAALNRVVGADVSTIQGSIRANGQVFLLNPNGILFTPTAQVNVGGLIASTLNISNQNFLDGNLEFQGNSQNAIVNQGSISSDGGNIALIAARIINDPGASITADRGQVLMGAGNKVTLDLGGSVRIRVDEGALQALIDQGGAVRADGGLVYLTARSASALGQTVINHTGVTRAQTVSTGPNGEIFLMGGMEADSIRVSGTLDASAPNGGDGGFIETSASNVQIMDDIAITTLAPHGQSGQWLIDPIDFYVRSSGGNVSGATISAALATTDVTIDTRTATNGADACQNVVCGGGAGTAGDIFIQDNITRASGGSPATTLSILAFRDIEISKPRDSTITNISTGPNPDSVTISGSNGNPLNLVLSARATRGTNTNLTGEVRIVNSTIRTFGGNVTIGGGDAAASSYAVAQASRTYNHGGSNTDTGAAGVRIRNSVIDASSDGGAQISLNSSGWWLGPHSYVSEGSNSNTGGDITIRGQSYISGPGVWLYGGASLTTAGTGAISLDGIGSTGGTFAQAGVLIEGRSPIIAKDGAITITGRASDRFRPPGDGAGYGVAFTEGNGLIRTMGAFNINAADPTSSKDDNAILIRDGNMTFDLGGNGELHAPLVGGDSTLEYSFTKSGSGTLTLFGDVPMWNLSRPTGAPRTTGTYSVTAGSLAYRAGLDQFDALYSFPPTRAANSAPDGAFANGPGAIAAGNPFVMSPATALRIRLAREDMIRRGVAPRDATADEIAQARTNAIEIFRANDTSRAAGIAIGIEPRFATEEEKRQAAEIREQRRQALLNGGDLPRPATWTEERLYNSLREENKRLIALGQFGPSMNAEERARVVQVQRRQMIARGQVPPNATFVERAEAAKNSVRNAVVNVFRGIFRR
ncbi:filamentous hemagglutinin N-terminal domain-containing protein [Rhodobacterales bacterium LSUCC0031]|nr:filamentous hemagglutinin N-terminal domain-containing protein [Rhodobacterales bacterium LSUCC0031]